MATRREIVIDDHELHELELDLRQAPFRVRWNATEALRYGAGEIDKEMLIDATGHHGNRFGRPGTTFVIPAPTVSHELIGPMSAEIGIETGHGKGNSGGIFHLLAYGGPINGPAYDPFAGPRRAIPRVLDRFADKAEESVFGRRGAA